MKLVITVFLLMMLSSLIALPFTDILNSEDYYAGLGKATTYEKADQKALKDLVSKISTSVEVNFQNVYTEEDGVLKEFAESIVKTYSNTMLRNTMSKVDEESEPGKVVVVRYVERQDLNKIFTDRKRKIIDYAKTAYEAENELRIGDALRYYYWSLVLLRSHPDNNSLYACIDEQDRTLITFLPNRIERVFSLLSLDVIKNTMEDAHRTIKLQICFNKQLVQNLDVMYYTGDSWSCKITTSNGFALLDFYDEYAKNLNQFDLKIEYIYYNKRNIDAEIRELLEDFDNPVFAASRKTVVINEEQTQSTTPIAPQVEIQPTFDSVSMAPYQHVMGEIIENLNDKNKEPSQDIFTEEGYQQFQKIVEYGNARLLSDDMNLFAARVNDEVTVRPVPVQFEFSNNDRKFTEYLTFIFNEDNKINAVNFALGEIAINDILNKSEAWGTLENKYQIIQFMEYYKTAYCLKNVDFVQNVFADNALIIIGNVLKQDKPIENMYQKLENVEYVRLSKQEYVERLQNAFRSNEYVNVSFEDNTVKKVNGDDKIYGIQIAQNYWSSNYADKGYLFLMIDLNDPKEPKIYVRSWQPVKSPDGSIIGLEDFQLY
ncbi:MAG: hypothetical protein DRI23_06295 [Candidatus Cloacimonadota bacterium]|nr:MAG: hypothetical protein DRI23_06295 [Candidatus Cloacimonadota bacterium]